MEGGKQGAALMRPICARLWNGIAGYRADKCDLRTTVYARKTQFSLRNVELALVKVLLAKKS